MNQAGRVANATAATITVIYIVIGYTSQIVKIFEQGTSSGLSGVLLALASATFISLTIAEITMRPINKGIVVSNGLGVVFSLVLLVIWALFTAN